MNLTRRGRPRFVCVSRPRPPLHPSSLELGNLAASRVKRECGGARSALVWEGSFALLSQLSPPSIVILCLGCPAHLAFRLTSHRLAGGQGCVGQEVCRGRGRGPLQPHPGASSTLPSCPALSPPSTFRPLHSPQQQKPTCTWLSAPPQNAHTHLVPSGHGAGAASFVCFLRVYSLLRGLSIPSPHGCGEGSPCLASVLCNPLQDSPKSKCEPESSTALHALCKASCVVLHYDGVGAAH